MPAAASRSATGHCLCGAVRFRAAEVPQTISVCHCEMCRRWTGSAFVEVSIPTDKVVWEGLEHVATRRFTSWAERAWCRECGAHVWFRHVREDEWFGSTEIPLGLFGDPEGFTISHEIYVDEKPDSFAFTGAHRRLTRAECVAAYPALDTESGS